MSERYPTLFSPIRIGPKEAKNRVWMTAHSTQLVKDHNFTQEHVDYYAERAKGGVGVITMEAMAVHPTTQPYKGKIFAFDPAVIPNYRKAAAVHEHGALLLAQPWHRGGDQRQGQSVAGLGAVGVPCTVYREMPHVLTDEEIRNSSTGTYWRPDTRLRVGWMAWRYTVCHTATSSGNSFPQRPTTVRMSSVAATRTGSDWSSRSSVGPGRRSVAA